MPRERASTSVGGPTYQSAAPVSGPLLPDPSRGTVGPRGGTIEIEGGLLRVGSWVFRCPGSLRSPPGQRKGTALPGEVEAGRSVPGGVRGGFSGRLGPEPPVSPRIKRFRGLRRVSLPAAEPTCRPLLDHIFGLLTDTSDPSRTHESNPPCNLRPPSLTGLAESLP